MIPRKATDKLLNLSAQFKAVAVIGPRQSGKTTLVKSLFPGKPFVSLEDPNTRSYALEDPRGVLAAGNDKGVVLYGGDQRQERSNGITMEGWERLALDDFLI
jgi:GTPase SAR1 family protein